MAGQRAREQGAALAGPACLIDASIYIFQAHFSPHARAEDELGRDQAAFLGFARFLLRFLRRARSDLVAVAFDESLFCGFRHELYPDYKSNRVLPDENLARQLAACATLCEALGLPAWGSPVYEADDIIGTLAARLREQENGRELRIVTRDKDLAQLLLREQDRLWDFQRDLLTDREMVEARFGIRPEQFPCYLGLTGDSVDCIPGVPGVGPVAASAMLQHFPAMQAIYENLDEVAGLGFRGARRMAERLQQHREQAELSRELATIVALPADSPEAFAALGPADLQRRPVDEAALRALYRDQQVRESEQARLAAMLEALLELESQA